MHSACKYFVMFEAFSQFLFQGKRMKIDQLGEVLQDGRE